MKKLTVDYTAIVDPSWFAECPQRGPFRATGQVRTITTDRVLLRFDNPNGTWVDHWFDLDDVELVCVDAQYAQYDAQFPRCPDPRD